MIVPCCVVFCLVILLQLGKLHPSVFYFKGPVMPPFGCVFACFAHLGCNFLPSPYQVASHSPTVVSLRDVWFPSTVVH